MQIPLGNHVPQDSAKVCQRGWDSRSNILEVSGFECVNYIKYFQAHENTLLSLTG